MVNIIQRHIQHSLQQDSNNFWINKLKELEEYKLDNDAKKLFKTTKHLMGTQNFNKGTYLIHNNQQIHDTNAQADVFADTWEEIMSQNTARPDGPAQQHFEDINIWKFTHLFHTIPHYTIEFNKLVKKKFP